MKSTPMFLKQVLTLSVSSVLWVACASPEATTTTDPAPAEASGAAPEDLIPVKAGHLVALDMAPLFVGVESGCFAENGLAVETIAFTNPGDNNAALAGSQIDFSTNPFTLPFFAANSGVPIKTVAAAGGWGVMQVIINNEVGVKSIAELVTFVTENPDTKLKIATLRGDTLELILVDAFEAADISVDAFEMVYFDDLLAMVDAFRIGEVDILSHIKPYTTQFVTSGEATVLTDNAEVWSPTTPNTVVSVLEKTLTEQPEVVESYIKGLQCAAEIINTDPEKAIEFLKDGNYYRVEDEVLLTAFETQPAPITFTPDLVAIQTVVEKMIALQYIESDVPTQDIFDTTIVKSLE
ncbi:MAG: ABC transporter substrate-binding protein [Cyanobacteria bacterium]|nr:ABC transporter substrate-binding protein [Cyanobacteriota bacterium]MDA0865553.1 ABC transporter substrate-binding protein [Cyanobacteriota bacterium]